MIANILHYGGWFTIGFGITQMIFADTLRGLTYLLAGVVSVGLSSLLEDVV